MRTMGSILTGILTVPLALALLTGCRGGQPAAQQPAQAAQAAQPAPPAGSKQEKIVLTVVSAFPRNATELKGFWKFADELKKVAGERIDLQYRGGPDVISPFQLAEAVSTGAVDVAVTTEAYYPNLLPVAHGMRLTPFSPTEERKNGVWEFYNQQHMDKLNVYYLGKVHSNVPFQLYLNKKIDEPSLKGMSMRVSPTYVAMVKALGGSPVSLPGGELYTALERGTVAGYGWASVGPVDLGFHKVTRYEVLPGFYQATIGILVNLDKWKRLPEDVKKTLTDVMVQTEPEIEKLYMGLVEKERQVRRDAGVQVLEFTGDKANRYLKAAYDAAWTETEQADAAVAAKLRQLYGMK